MHVDTVCSRQALLAKALWELPGAAVAVHARAPAFDTLSDQDVSLLRRDVSLALCVKSSDTARALSLSLSLSLSRRALHFLSTRVFSSSSSDFFFLLSRRSGEACSAALRNALLRDVGLDLATTRPLCHVAATDAPLAHSITNKRYAISVSWMVLQTDARLEERHQDAPRLCWLTESELNSKGTSSAILKAIQAAKTLALKDQDDDKMTN